MSISIEFPCYPQTRFRFFPPPLGLSTLGAATTAGRWVQSSLRSHPYFIFFLTLITHWLIFAILWRVHAFDDVGFFESTDVVKSRAYVFVFLLITPLVTGHRYFHEKRRKLTPTPQHSFIYNFPMKCWQLVAA